MISRYLEVIPVSLREIAEKDEKSRTCVANLFPKLMHNFIAIFHISKYLGPQWRYRLLPKLRVSSDLTGSRLAGTNPGQAKNNYYFFLE